MNDVMQKHREKEQKKQDRGTIFIVIVFLAFVGSMIAAMVIHNS